MTAGAGIKPPPHMKWVQTYPHAENRADYNSRNADLLIAQRNAIRRALNSTNRAANLESYNLSGAYYDEFVTRTGYWTEDFNRIYNGFESFLAELDLLISAAEGFESLWRSRVLLGRWVEIEV